MMFERIKNKLLSGGPGSGLIRPGPLCLGDAFSEEMFAPCIMCVQYIGGCSVHQGDP